MDTSTTILLRYIALSWGKTTACVKYVIVVGYVLLLERECIGDHWEDMLSNHVE